MACAKNIGVYLIFMKNCINAFLLSSLLAATAFGAAPKSPKYSDYAVLLSRSPFGKKVPPAVEIAPVVETKSTLTLTGLSRLSDGWMITLMDATKPTERIIIMNGADHPSGVSVVEVHQDPSDYTKTSVVVKQGGRNFKVGFNMLEIEKNIARAVKTNQASKPAVAKTGSAGNAPKSTSNAEYEKKRNEMMKEAEALRKMRDAGNEGDEYTQRRKALMEKANEMRGEWRQRRRGSESSGGGDRRR